MLFKNRMIMKYVSYKHHWSFKLLASLDVIAELMLRWRSKMHAAL